MTFGRTDFESDESQAKKNGQICARCGGAECGAVGVAPSGAARGRCPDGREQRPTLLLLQGFRHLPHHSRNRAHFLLCVLINMLYYLGVTLSNLS